MNTCVRVCAFVRACVFVCVCFSALLFILRSCCPLRSPDSPHAASVTAVDDSGNERSCDFDIFITVDEHVLARTEIIRMPSFPLQQQYAPASSFLFYSHMLIPAPDSPIQTLQVRLGCEKETTPIPLKHMNTRTHPHPCFSSPPSTPPPQSGGCVQLHATVAVV